MGSGKKILSVLFVLTGVSATLASCSVADAPPNSPAPVKNVADYYYPLSDVGMQYAYLRTTNIGSDTVRLKMQGNDAMSSAIGNTQCFAADLYKIGAFQSDLFFAVNDSEAYTLGTISCGTLGGYWLDLKTPLTEHLQWTFTTNGSYASITVTATVIHRGLKMKMPSGMTFDDVTEVLYVTNNADTTTKWFARGVGMVYSTSNQSDNYFGSQMKFISEIK